MTCHALPGTWRFITVSARVLHWFRPAILRPCWSLTLDCRIHVQPSFTWMLLFDWNYSWIFLRTLSNNVIRAINSNSNCVRKSQRPTPNAYVNYPRCILSIAEDLITATASFLGSEFVRCFTSILTHRLPLPHWTGQVNYSKRKQSRIYRSHFPVHTRLQRGCVILSYFVAEVSRKQFLRTLFRSVAKAHIQAGKKRKIIKWKEMQLIPSPPYAFGGVIWTFAENLHHFVGFWKVGKRANQISQRGCSRTAS